ncbi:hypothetical protein KW791_02375 [Candidatus Parcubacteria bacterium]|nr:hypothetical protein [Candidatus Parcubacteria bacterium]
MTRDKKFLEAAEKEWNQIKNDQSGYKLAFNTASVVDLKSGIEFIIEQIECKNYGTDAAGNQHCAIEKLNKRMAR